MAVGYRSSSRSGASDDFGTSCVVPVPSGAASGDIALVAVELWESFGASVTAPSGFTLILDTNTGPQRMIAWWKRLSAADTGSYTATWTGSCFNQGNCILITGGLAAGDPIEASNSAVNTSTTAIPATSVTTATLAFLGHFVSNDSVSTGTPPTSFTEVQDGDYIRANYRIPGGTGTFTTSGGTASGGGNKVAALIAVKPAAAGGGPVDLVANGAAANGATGSASVARPIAASGNAASGLTGSAGAARPIAGSGSSAGGFSGAATFARGLTASAGSSAGATGAMSVARGMGATSPSASSFAGALAGGVQKDLDGSGSAAAGFSGANAVARGLASSVSSASGASGAVTLSLGFAGVAACAASATGDLSLVQPTWRLVVPQIVERYTMRGSLSTTMVREPTVFGDENGLFTVLQGSPSEGTDEYGAIPFGTKYIWYGGHVNVTDDPAVKNLWLSHGFEVENVQL